MNIEVVGTIIFGLAVLHTFLTAPILRISHRYPKDSFRGNILHFLGEIEVVFGIWAAVFLSIYAIAESMHSSISYLQKVNFVEPLFIFTVMTVCSTRPILHACRVAIVAISALLKKIIPLSEVHVEMFVILTVGPLAGSFITEPAAMTVTAFLILSMINTKEKHVLYGLLTVLFVNISIGGSLTPYAAPPILMVASAWNWDFSFIFTNLGWKSCIAVLVNSLFFTLVFRKGIAEGFSTLQDIERKSEEKRLHIPLGITLLHLLFLLAIILTAHYENVFMGLLLFFLGIYSATRKYQDALRLKESLLVAFFLGGIIVFGPFQAWWLKPLLNGMSESLLFLGATVLTAFTDNAALTFLGSQVEGLSSTSKIALVSGALAGGGLTIIANAPNPAGVSILNKKFPEGQISPLLLLLHAIIPTIIAASLLWFLP